MNKKTSICFLFFFAAIAARADQTKAPAAANTTSSDQIDLIRCERFKMESVSDLKEKLATNCDINKPYSFTGADALGGNPMITYCCRKKGS